jgi:hypothetical protein
MDHWRYGVSTRQVREEIDAALAHGLTLRDVEREILDVARVSDDARSALWLYAWGASERRARRWSRPLAATTWGRDGSAD